MTAQDIYSTGPTKKVLFVCSKGSARSQIAEAYLNTRYRDLFEAYTLTDGPPKVSNNAVQAMNEIGLDISQKRLKTAAELEKMGIEFDYLVTMCETDGPSNLSAKVSVHKPFDDPTAKGTDTETVSARTREVRDEIISWIDDYFGEKVKRKVSI